MQWYWLQDCFPERDQFNSLHERLVAGWMDLAPHLKGPLVHFASADAPEDVMTTAYMRDVASQAGLETVQLSMEEIGYNAARIEFGDLERREIHTCFKLYPWEWMVHEEFGRHLVATYSRTQWIEPAWKQVLSNKGILAILWELFPDHPNLLPASFHPEWAAYVKKPLMSREGANIEIVRDGAVTARGSDQGYGGGGFVYQAWTPLFTQAGKTCVIGSWLVQGNAAGIGVRESEGPITDNLSRFVPHCII